MINMGRGVHKNHIEEKIQVNVKFTKSKFLLLQEHHLIGIITANQYVNMLVNEDLIRRGIV